MNKKLSASLRLAVATLLFAGATLTVHANWPQWRGPNRDDLSKETGLLKSWPESGPQRLWVFDTAGLGYSGPAIVAGKLFTMGAREDGDHLLAVSIETGKQLWTTKISEMLKNGWGDGPRGTPCVDGDRVYALSGRGTIVCASVADGKITWQHTMREFGGKTPGWGYTESVLVDGNKVLCTPGGPQGTVIALDKKTGATLWQSKEFTDDAHYSSIIAADHAGKRQYIQRTEKTIAGLAADDGKLLWTSDFPGRTAVIPTPIYHDNHVYVTAGYGAGCKLVKLSPNNEATPVYATNAMVNHHGGVILVDGHVYGHSDQGGWVCQNFKTGERVWADRSLGKGAIAYADGKFYCLAENDGTVVLIDATTSGWKENGRFKLEAQSAQRNPKGKVWTHPVITGGRLYLRDQEFISCYDVKAK
jgi:outer membrane protein assembly factor BamB